MTPIEEIKSKLNIVDVVSGYIRLEKSGAQWKARCPFHHEKTPSFYISPERGSYHCFGCQEHGDIFTFVEKIEHIPFVEALKLLADRAQVSLSNYKKREGDRDSRLIEILTLAKEKYMENLNSSVEAKDYLLDRGLTPFSIQLFNVGFAKSEWRDLFTYLMGKGFTPEEIVESGLVIKTDDGKYYDRFRGRIMFPIHNVSNAIVGFTGRVLPQYDDGKTGKYVNTPETAVYHKSNVLYNYNRAKKSMNELRTVVLVEGQMDVIMSTQAGVENVIAVSGTAFTDYHVKMIKRLADNVIISFDNDRAGQSARDKAIQMCLAEGLEVWVPTSPPSPLSEGEGGAAKDAADIVKESSETWRQMIEHKVPLFDFLIKETLTIENVKDRINYIRNNVLQLLFYISSPLARNHLLQHIAGKLAIAESVLREELERLRINGAVGNYNNDSYAKRDQDTKSRSSSDLANADGNNRASAIYNNIELQYLALCRHLNLEIDDEIRSLLSTDYPNEMIEGTLLYMHNMAPAVDMIQNGKKLDAAGIREAERQAYVYMHSDLILKIKKRHRSTRIDKLNSRLRIGGLTDLETFAILKEIAELKKTS